jgi:hypothetical protein
MEKHHRIDALQQDTGPGESYSATGLFSDHLSPSRPHYEIRLHRLTEDDVVTISIGPSNIHISETQAAELGLHLLAASTAPVTSEPVILFTDPDDGDRFTEDFARAVDGLPAGYELEQADGHLTEPAAMLLGSSGGDHLVELIVETMDNTLFDETGDEHIDLSKSMPDSARDELKTLLAHWARKNFSQHRYYRAENIRPYIITEEDLQPMIQEDLDLAEAHLPAGGGA